MPPPEAVISVIDPETGESYAIEESTYRAAPDAYQLAEGQVIAYDPTGGVAPVTAGLEVTREALVGPEIGARISAEEMAAQERGHAADVLEGGVGGKIAAVGRGLASSATLGLSERAFRPETGIEAELEDMRRQVVGDYQAGAELIGDVGLALASGGTGLLARGARATAPGLLAGASTRIAGTGRGLGRQVIAGAFEQAATDVGKAMARAALDDEPLSLSALASTASTSALLGGGAAGLLGVAGRGVKRLAARDAPTPAEQLLAASTDTAALTRLLRDAEQGTLARAADDVAAGTVRKPVSVGKLFSKRGKAPEMSRRAASELVEQVTARGGRAAQVRTVLDDAIAGARAAGADIPDALVSRVRMAIDDHAIAAREAADFLPAIAADAERASAGKAVAVTSEAVPAMRRLDAADRDLAGALADVRKALPAQVTTEAAPEAQGLLSRAADALGVYEGAADVAGMAGTKIPSLRNLPGVGPLVAGAAKVRMLAKAAANLGVIPGSGLTDAAEVAAVAADRFRAAVDRVARGRLATSGALARAGRVGTVAVARAMAADVLGADAAQVEQAVEGRYAELPDDLRAGIKAAAVRRLEHLQSVAPNPPPGFESVPQLWSPTPSQAQQFGEVVAALDAPLDAVASILAGQWRYPLDVVAGVRAVYPDVYAETQAELVARSDALVRNNPRELVAQWARMFEVPILPELQASYSTPSAPMQSLTPRGMPPASASSPMVEGAAVRPRLQR